LLILFVGESKFVVKAALIETTNAGNRANPDETADFPHGDIIYIPEKIEYWRNGLIYYHFSANTSKDDQLLVWKAMEDFHNQTCIRFEENRIQRESVYIHIDKTINTCYTNLGRTSTNSTLVLGKSCLKHGVIVHLLMHCLGVYHENNRPIRDKYLEINLENVRPGSRKAFEILHLPDENLLPQNYDFESITHYSAYAFAINESIPTVTALNSNEHYGQRVGLSIDDINKVRILYQCKEPYLPQIKTTLLPPSTSTALPTPIPTKTNICFGNDKHNAKFPHPTDCSLFIHCSHGVGYEFFCGKNLVFDPHKGWCVYPSEYNCKI